MDKRFSHFFNILVRHFEYALAVTVIIAIIVTLLSGIQELSQMDWRNTDTFYDMLHRVLALVIGLEFVRMLITHKLNVVLELLAFVIARKMLLPGLTALDIIFSVTAFVILMTARHFMFQDDIKVEHEEEKNE